MPCVLYILHFLLSPAWYSVVVNRQAACQKSLFDAYNICRVATRGKNFIFIGCKTRRTQEHALTMNNEKKAPAGF